MSGIVQNRRRKVKSVQLHWRSLARMPISRQMFWWRSPMLWNAIFLTSWRWFQ